MPINRAGSNNEPPRPWLCISKLESPVDSILSDRNRSHSYGLFMSTGKIFSIYSILCFREIIQPQTLEEEEQC